MLQIFNYTDREMRTVVKNGEPWFVAKDVCEVLSISKYRDAVSRLYEDESISVLVDTLGGNQEMTAINEAGLYSLIMVSRKPEAKQFKRWITHEVIPSIRKHGIYATQRTLEEMLSNPDTMIKTLQALKDEREHRKLLQLEVDKNKPKVLFADAVSASHTTILIGELAKLIKQNGVDMGQNRMFEWLRNNEYLTKRKGTDYNMPTQKSMELGLFEVKETSISHSDGHITVSKTPKVTGKGQQYFINKFLN
jgi:anti-repressor protein